MEYRYLPFLKAKAGEIVALENLTPSARARVLPLIHIGETLSPNFGKRMAAAWTSHPLAVDGAFNHGSSGSVTSFVALIQELRNKGASVMPCVGVSDPINYVNAALAAKDENGIVVKATLATLNSSYGWVSQHGLVPGEVDLVIDLKHIAAIDPQTFSGYVLSVLLQGAQALNAFRSVTLASAAAPKDHSSLAYGANLVPRTDWTLWLATHPHSPVKLDYGDYSTGHPDLTEPPGVAMANATVSARYTLDADWLIIKGRSTGGINGQPMAVQYISHAALISANSNFGGVAGCWADSRVQHAAAGGQGVGSRGKWAEIAANRHISLVADRLP